MDDDSTMGKRKSYEPHLLDKLIVLERYGRDFLTPDELQGAHRRIEHTLIRFLAWSLLRAK